MANLHYRNVLVEYIDLVTIEDAEDGYFVVSYSGSRIVNRAKFGNPKQLRIEINGNIESVDSTKDVTIFGNVSSLSAYNSAKIQGYVQNIECRSNNISYDSRVRVISRQFNGDRIIITGDLKLLNVRCNNLSLDVVVNGNCGMVVTHNNGKVKGNVAKVFTNNGVVCSMR